MFPPASKNNSRIHYLPSACDGTEIAYPA